MADSVWDQSLAAAEAAPERRVRHSASVRLTHWAAALCFFALLISGVEIVISHPRFYWGEAGNSGTPPLFRLPIPSSRATVPTGYGYVLPDQNGWSRALHFQSAWAILLTGLLYLVSGLASRHFERNLIPAKSDLTWATLSKAVANHLRFRRPGEDEAWSYNVLQRLAYLGVVFAVFPLMIWTGLAMSPGFTAAVPAAVTLLGGHQSARTIHFFGTLFLTLFLAVHLAMVCLAGFRGRTAAMITGRIASKENP